MNATKADARMIWGIIPRDCKPNLEKLRRRGLMERARPAILAEAEAGLKLLDRYTLIDVCVSLELAAAHWLEHHEAAQAQLSNQPG